LASIERRFAKLAARLSRLEWEAQEVTNDVKLLHEDLERVLEPEVSKRPAAGVDLRRTLARKQEDLQLTRHGQNWQAGAGIENLEVRHQSDGSYEVKIDGKTPFRLAAGLGLLLRLLATVEGFSDDECVGWKNVGSLQRDLTRGVGRNVTPRAVRQLVYRLRKESKRYSNPEYLQSDRVRGYRFALTRPNSKKYATPSLSSQSRLHGAS
jgi:hypothetical protein